MYYYNIIQNIRIQSLILKLFAKSGDLVTICLNSVSEIYPVLLRSVSLSTFSTTFDLVVVKPDLLLLPNPLPRVGDGIHHLPDVILTQQVVAVIVKHFECPLSLHLYQKHAVYFNITLCITCGGAASLSTDIIKKFFKKQKVSILGKHLTQAKCKWVDL